MITKEEGKNQLKHLVKRFSDNLEQYKQPGYKEHHVRSEFIDGFFKSFGWDVDNSEGNSEKYKEVIGEDRVRIGGQTKAPDYAFRLGGRRVFFVEAKKPSVNIKGQSEPSFQLKRYAWNSKIPISILTDFEEFSVYDCSKKPDLKEKAESGRLEYFNFEEYVENFDKLWDIFSKESVLKGSFDRYVDSSKNKRGTSQVDGEFLKEIETWREKLAKNIARRNTSLSVDHLNFCVQKTIDRILFLRICEDRGIESYGKLKNISGNPNVYQKLLDAFEDANAKYNSGIFDFSEGTITKELSIDDDVLQQIISNLYYPISPYDFSVLSVEILGNVYEEFLGKIIRLTPAHIAKIEEKPEVKIAGGVFYTPEFVVEYIIKNTLDPKIDGKTPQEIEKIRILDPACGSGTFLLRAYSYLLDYHLDYYRKNPKKYKKEIYEFKENQWFLTTEIRKKILLNNIFGVDIDHQAVELTKLGLHLKVLENETEETVNQQLKLFQERALPDLGNNIKCGNSLVNSSYSIKNKTSNHEKLFKINPFDWDDKENGFGAIINEGGFDIIIGNPPYVKEDVRNEIFEFVKSTDLKKYYQGKMDYWHFFTGKSLDLLKEDGLHSFIAQNNWNTSSGASILRNKILEDSRIITFFDFNEFRVFKKASIQTMIFVLKKMKEPGKTYKTNYYKITSKNISKEQISNYTYNVHAINVMGEGDAVSNFLLGEVSGIEVESFSAEIIPNKLINKTINFVNSQVDEVLEKISSKRNQKLRDTEIGNGIDVLQDFVSKKHLGKLSGKIKKGDGVFVLNKSELNNLKFNKIEMEKIKPYYTSENLEKFYGSPKNNYWIIYADTEVRTNIEKFPTIKHHLDQFKPILTSAFKPYGLHRPREQRFFEGEKLFSLRKTMMPSFTFTDFPCYVTRAFLILKPEDIDLKYLVGVLNSELSYFMFYFTGKKQGEQLQIDKEPLLNFPIHVPENKNENDLSKKIIESVDLILEAKKELKTIRLEQERKILEKKIQFLEKEVNGYVYGMYDLSEDDINTIRTNLKIKK